MNAKYLVHFKNPRDLSQFGHLARQIYPENWRELMRVFKEICAEPHGYIFFDLSQSAHTLLRFQTNIFNKNHSVVYCCPDSDKTVKNETIGGEQVRVVYTL